MHAREVEHTGGGADLVVAHNVAILPCDVADVGDDWIPFLQVEGHGQR